MKKELKIVKAAKWAKVNGYKYMSSVVKSYFSTVYFHVVDIDDVIKEERWIPSGGRGQIRVPNKTVLRSYALSKIK